MNRKRQFSRLDGFFNYVSITLNGSQYCFDANPLILFCFDVLKAGYTLNSTHFLQ